MSFKKCQYHPKINMIVLGSIKCNECDKNNYVDFDGQTKQKATTRIKDQAHFITYQKKNLPFLSDTAVNLFNFIS